MLCLEVVFMGKLEVGSLGVGLVWAAHLAFLVWP